MKKLKSIIGSIFSIKFKKEHLKLCFFGLKLSFKTGHIEYKEKYEQLILGINYISKEFALDKILINRIKKNYKFNANEKSYVKDKTDLQNHYDKTIQPSKLKPAKGKLREHQLKILNTTKEILAPLEKENIRYTLNGGFLIGAFRHGGFIPWDDDADFDLIRPDYEKFIQYVKNKYIYLDTSSCKDCVEFWQLMNKCLIENSNQIIFAKLNGYLQAYVGTSVSNHVTLDFIPWDCIDLKTTKEEYLNWKNKFVKVYTNPNLTWGEKEEAYYHELETNKIFTKNYDNCKIIRNFSLYGITNPNLKDFLHINVFYPAKKVKFEDTEFFAANNHEKYLALDFKDYRKIPAVIDYAKFIKNLSQGSKDLFGVEYYIQYEDIVKDFIYE